MINLETLEERTLESSLRTQALWVIEDSRIMILAQPSLHTLDTPCEIWDLDCPPGQEFKKTVQLNHGAPCTTGLLFAEVIDRNRLVTGNGKTKTLRVWDISRPRDEECIAKLQLGDDPICAIAVNENNEIIGDGETFAYVWNLAQPHKIKRESD